MVRILLAAASLAAILVPASAVSARHAVGIGVPNAKPTQSIGFDHRFRHRGGGEGAVIWGGYDLQSSYEDRDWRPDTGNDWWNERPDRAYPRWVQEQQARGTCEPDRMWWSGSGWHC
jgi:hypothetical protein